MVTRRALEDADDVDDVVYLVVDELVRIVDALPLEEQPAFVRSLSPGKRMVWGVFLVDGEVSNGGFNQYFWNGSGAYAQEARDGFRLIGADPQVKLLDEAVARFEEHVGALTPFYEQGSMEAFSESYEQDVFGDLDERYWELDTASPQAAYIRAHPDEFVSDEREASAGQPFSTRRRRSVARSAGAMPAGPVR